MDFVTTDALTKQYADVTALSGCTMTVRRGEVLGLLGPNGSGKTTLLRLLMGYLKPTSGSATIDSLDCYHQSVQVHKRVSYLPGDVRLFPRMRGREVLRFFSEVRSGGDHQRALALADRLELDLSRQVAFHSTGMRQKLALAATLSIDVPLLILDEPTANLDPTVRADVVTMVDEARTAGRTVVFSSHVLSEVERVSDRVIVLRQGELVHTQIMSELNRQHRIRATLVGPMPPVPSELEGQIEIVVANGRLQIETPGDLSSLLGWLAVLPIEEVMIQPLGLQAVYERFHSIEAS